VPKRKKRKTKDLWQFFLHALPMLQTPPPLIYKLMAGLDYGEELPWSRVVGEWITKWPRLLQWRTSSMDEKNDMVPNMVNFLLGDFYEGQAYLITSNPQETWPPKTCNLRAFLFLFFLHLVRHTQGVHSLLYFAYTCVHDLFIGGVIYLARKIIR
jgi:hypothetical protein